MREEGTILTKPRGSFREGRARAFDSAISFGFGVEAMGGRDGYELRGSFRLILFLEYLFSLGRLAREIGARGGLLERGTRERKSEREREKERERERESDRN